MCFCDIADQDLFNASTEVTIGIGNRRYLYFKLTQTNVKLMLYCFEWMTGLKINHYKSEVYLMGLTEDEKIKVASMLNCKIGSFSMIYLGIPVSDSHLSIN